LNMFRWAKGVVVYLCYRLAESWCPVGVKAGGQVHGTL
jgi:hypothetical protein